MTVSTKSLARVVLLYKSIYFVKLTNLIQIITIEFNLINILCRVRVPCIISKPSIYVRFDFAFFKFT